MFSGSLVDTIKQYWALIYERLWANWGLLMIVAAAAVLLILLVIGWRRLRGTDREPERARMTERRPEMTANQRVQLLQREIIQRDHTEARLEREISELTAANKQLQRKNAELTSANERLRQEAGVSKKACERSEQKIAELTAVNKQLQGRITESTRASEQLQREGRQAQESAEQRAAELMVVNEQLRQELAASRETGERSEQKIAELTAVNKQTEDKISELMTANEQLQREGRQAQESAEQKVAELMLVNEQLRQELAASKETGDHSGQQIAELAVADGPLQHEVVEQRRTRGKGIDKRRKEEAPRVEKMVSMSDISLKAKSPAQQLKELAEEIVDSNVLKGISGPDAKRVAILEACDCLDANNVVMAVEALKKFINAVEAQQGDNDEIPQKEEAEDWIAAARGLIHLLTAG